MVGELTRAEPHITHRRRGGGRETDPAARPRIAVAPTTARRTLFELDGAIRRGTTTNRTVLRVLFVVAALFMLTSLCANTLIVDAGPSRNTLGAVVSFLVVAALVIYPIVSATGGQGLQPRHVRHLPVRASDLRAALAAAALFSPGTALTFLGLSIGTVAVATSDRSIIGAVLSWVATLLLTAAGVAAARVLMIAFENALNSPTARIVATVLGVAFGAAAYGLFTVLGGVADGIGRDETARVIARTLPTGWPVVAGEAAAGGHWWLSAIVLVALAGGATGLYRLWSVLLARALDGRSATKPARSSAATDHSRDRVRSALATALLAEAELLVRDTRRLGLLMMPAVFTVLGVILLVTSADIYAMAYGSPLVVIIAGSAFFNAYGLDGRAFWRMVVVPGAARLALNARMVLVAVITGTIGLLGTVAGRLFSDTDSSTLAVAAAVLVAAVCGTSAASGVQSALSPYSVPETSGTSALTARGSMSVRSVAISLLAMLFIAVLCLPGALLAALLPGPAAWLGAAVSVTVGATAIAVGRRWAEALVLTRGPEIYATVSAP